MESLNKSISNIKREIDKTKNSTSEWSSVQKTINFSAIYLGAKKALSALKGMNDEAINYAETLNLFNVSFGKDLEGLDQYYKKALNFQRQLEEKLGVNIEESMNYQSLFNSMSKSMGISAKYSYILSENFTKMGYDLASLFNINTEEAMRKLRAGLAGETEPLRAIGLDITEQSLQPVLDSLGIEESLRNMTQAEKIVLRYIAVVNQAQMAQGDFVNTIDSQANQLRIFNAQVTAFKRNMGNLWQGFLGGLLPYVNAIMLVINELLKMVAKLFNFKVSEQPVNISASVGLDDLTDDLETAEKKAKALKAQLLGFDETNNITLENNSNAGSAGGASVGGIDQRLLDAIEEYDNLMGKVKNKATDIRDKIMGWLGFTKKINPLTGEISWEYTGMSKSAKIILNILKSIALLYISSKVLKLIGYLRTLKGVISGTVIPTTSFQNGLSLVSRALKDTGAWLQLGVEQFKIYRKAGDSVTSSIGKTTKGLLDLIPTTVKVTGGITGLVGSSTLAYKSMQELSGGTIGAGEAMLKLSGSIVGATTSGALIGSVFGPAGAVIGGLTGLIISGTSAFEGYEAQIKSNLKTMGNSATDFIKGIESATSYLDDFNSTLFASSEEQQELQTQMEEIQKGITAICKTASDERRDYTREEIVQLDKYFEELRNLKNREIEIQNQIATAISQQAITNAETFEGSLEQYKVQSQDWIKTAEEQCNKTIELIKSGTIEEIALLNQRYGDQANMQNEAYANEYNTIISQRDQKIKIAQEEVSKVNQAYTEGYLKRIKENDSFYNKIKEYSERQQQLEEKHNEKIRQIKDGELWYVTNTYQALQNENQIYATNTGDIWKQMYKDMSDQQIKELGIWLAMVSQTEMYGGEISQETQDLVDSIIKSYESMPPKTQEAMKEAMEPMLTEMENKEPELYAKARNIPEGILAKLREVFDIHSPSRKTRDIFKNVMLGMEYGLNDGKGNLLDKVSTLSEEILQKFKKESTARNIGIDILRGLNTGISNGSWQGTILGTASNFANKLLNKFKKAFDINSPSKKTRLFGIYLLEGLGLGIQQRENNVLRTVENFSDKVLNEFTTLTTGFSNEIRINPQDYKVDTNQFIDYGQISGAIATQNNVKIESDLSYQMKQAIIEGMRNIKIPVEIEAKTEEGIIFKKVQKSANEYLLQTGENPFPVLA